MTPRSLIYKLIEILCERETGFHISLLKIHNKLQNINKYDIDLYFANKFSVSDEEKSGLEDFKKHVKLMYYYTSELLKNDSLIDDTEFIFKLQHVVYTCYYKHLFYDKYPNEEVLVKEIKERFDPGGSR